MPVLLFSGKLNLMADFMPQVRDGGKELFFINSYIYYSQLKTIIMIAAYITFNGNTEEAFNFYASALEGKITSLQHFSDSPGGGQMPDADKKKIMHIALDAPHGVRLMGNDHVDSMGESFVKGNNFSLSLHPDSQELADKLFKNLSAGGKVIVPMAKAPWGDYFGMFTDKFGIKWMINHQAK
jgi:PhnB protein